ncbi:MAG TPA: sigma-70 family RNA polymerase sigma factor [Candidatus Polarisedimenticolaceae bacterium]|nr:sigma-70 family RNA polymerase sigma factor [Candidatus Polarisedimenticolaceae bacterium]
MHGGRNRAEEVAAFLRGDPGEVAHLEKAVRTIVRSFRFRNSDLDRDLVQETLSRTLDSLSGRRFRGIASLRTYACNVARYTCLEHIRRRRQEVAFDPELHPSGDRCPPPEEFYISLEEHRRNLEAFNTLPGESREILRLICVEGASYREVATRLGISEGALKSRIHRFRLSCREAAKAPARLIRLVAGRPSS